MFIKLRHILRRSPFFRLYTHIRDKTVGFGSIKNFNKTKNNKHCLFVYNTNLFKKDINSTFHQNVLQAQTFTRILDDYGFSVDVINVHGREPNMRKQYDLIVHAHPGLNSNCISQLTKRGRKIAYITGSNQSFCNLSEEIQLKLLYQRKGVMLKQRRNYLPFPKHLFEPFDGMFLFGNEYTLDTYREFNLKKIKIHLLPNTGWPFLATDDFSKKFPHKFLYIGTIGSVHKGLDKLIDIFTIHPEIELHICSDIKAERDFYSLYRNKIREFKNIILHGFVPLECQLFKNLTLQCSYVLLPSCSEGASGSVVTGMSAGMIPIVSEQCGFDSDIVHHFDSLRIEDIEKSILQYSKKSLEWIISESKRMMNIANTTYSKEAFEKAIRKGLDRFLA